MLCVVISFSTLLSSPIINPIYNEPVEVVKCSTFSIKDFFKNLFSKDKDINDDNYKPVEVFLGGKPLGFTISCEGVIVVAISNVMTENGTRKPTKNSDIKEGDILLEIAGEQITSAADINEIINKDENKNKNLEVLIERGDRRFKTTIYPELDKISQSYKLGLWIRDNAAGVGTLTYIRADNNRFGALGHPVCDIDTGAKMNINQGKIFNCNIVGVTRGKRGIPGELRGMFLKSGSEVGSLDKNCEVGVFGDFQLKDSKFSNKKILTMSKDKVKTGKAQIYCTIDGTTPDFYDVEIVKINYQGQNNKKNMVIRVVDERLIEKTGGIVQGMSGSPIVQDGKLVGAMTHVFVNDPTKGFAIYIDYMINN